MNDLERNRSHAIAYYRLMFNDCRPREAIERFAGDDSIQHNPHVAIGKAGLLTISNAWRAGTPERESKSSVALPKATWWSFIATRSGRAASNTLGSTFPASTLRGKTWGTGTFCRKCPRSAPTKTEFFYSQESTCGARGRFAPARTLVAVPGRNASAPMESSTPSESGTPGRAMLD